MVCLDDTQALAMALVERPSPSGGEAELCRWLADHLERSGLAVQRLQVDGDRFDLLCGSERFDVLMCTHLDTVPGGPAPTLVESEGERYLVGRGACDAKGIAAAMLGALIDLGHDERARTAVLLVVGEETASDGARAAAEQLEPGRYVVVGEPTELRFAKLQRGALAVSIEVEGRPCHSGYPERGRSAVHELLDILDLVRRSPWPSHPEFGETLVNVGVVEGGCAANVLAARARAEIMVRPSVPVGPLIERLEEMVRGRGRLEVRTASDPQMLYVPRGESGVTVGFASDVAHLRRLGEPILVGPGSIHVAHTDDERLSVAELEAARRLYADLCRRLLGGHA